MECFQQQRAAGRLDARGRDLERVEQGILHQRPAGRVGLRMRFNPVGHGRIADVVDARGRCAIAIFNGSMTEVRVWKISPGPRRKFSSTCTLPLVGGVNPEAGGLLHDAGSGRVDH